MCALQSFLETDKEERGEINLHNVRETKRKGEDEEEEVEETLSVWMKRSQEKEKKKISRVQLSWRENH